MTQIGVVFPQTEFGNDHEAIKAYAQTVEELGFSHIMAYDHVLGVNPERPEGWQGVFSSKDPFHEVFQLFSFMAGVTEKIQFETGILILPQRQTALVAKQAASLDVLSGGRLRLGIGLGWNYVEYEALDQNFNDRGKRIEEQVDVLRKLWTNEAIRYEGQWHSIPDAGINPLPVQRPIPLWFGGHHENVLDRVARLGDGWLPFYRTVEDTRPSWDIIQEHAAQAGRDPKTIGLEQNLRCTDGGPDEWLALMDDWIELGATHISFNTLGVGFTTPQQHIDAIREFAAAL